MSRLRRSWRMMRDTAGGLESRWRAKSEGMNCSLAMRSRTSHCASVRPAPWASCVRRWWNRSAGRGRRPMASWTSVVRIFMPANSYHVSMIGRKWPRGGRGSPAGGSSGSTGRVMVGPAMPAVAIHELRKRFPRTTALDGLSFTVQPGEVVGLLGANGAGKTTTLHILLGLILPSGGRVEVFGQAPRAHRKAALRRVGFASPEALMDWRLTVAENLRVFAGLYGVPREAVERMIERFELGPMADQPFGELSLGQQTRAGLA